MMKLIKKLFLIGLVLSILGGVFLAGIFTNDALRGPEIIVKKQSDISSIEDGTDLLLLELANDARRSEGITVLEWDTCLKEQAFNRAREIAQSKNFTHKDANGKNAFVEYLNICFPDGASYGGENLVQHAFTASSIHATLMNSKAHRGAILDPRYQRIGIGCFDYVCVQFFIETKKVSQKKPAVYHEKEEVEDDWEEEWKKKLEREEAERETLRYVQEMEIEREAFNEQMAHSEQSQKEFDAYWEQQHSQQLWDKAMELSKESEERLERLENYTPTNILDTLE